MTHIHMLATNQDNYFYLVHHAGATIVIDPREAAAVLAYLDQHGCHLALILNTHMHQDHCQGNVELKQATGCVVIGGDERIPGIDHILKGESLVPQLNSEVPSGIEVIYTPGHTLADCCYYLPPSEHFAGALFSGDTLFSGGCGRVFEGTMEQLFNSLQLLKCLPEETLIYCGHEDSLENYRFAVDIEPKSVVISNKLRAVQLQRERGEVTLPVTLGQELKTNPFLHTDDYALRRAVKMEQATELEVFTALMKRKNRF